MIMKKKMSLIMFAILGMSVLSLQAGVRVGVKAGVNLAKASLSTNAIQTDNFTGFQVGPMIEASALGLGFDAAILYNQYGLKTEDTNETVSSLDVPVNLKMKFSLAGLVGAFVTAGPYASFKVATPKALQDEWNTKSFGAGLNFGVGVELLKKLQVGVNYRLPLTDDYSNFSITDAAGNIIKGNGKTTIWSITAAYFF